jgi:hypothetical protein
MISTNTVALDSLSNPWVQFSEPEFSGKFLHIDDDAPRFPDP